MDGTANSSLWLPGQDTSLNYMCISCTVHSRWPVVGTEEANGCRSHVLRRLKGQAKRRKHFRRKRPLSRDSEDPNEDYDDKIHDQVITFPCSIGKHEIDLPGIFSHRKQHAPLATLDFPWMGRNKSAPSVIAVQKHSIITKLLESFTFTEQILQNINNTSELPWKKQIPAYYKIIDNIHNSSVYSQNICHLLIKGVAICDDRNSTWKADVNDRFTGVNNFGNKHDVFSFGLFDGHHESSRADFTAAELPVLLLYQLSGFDPSYQLTPKEQKLSDSFHTVFREEFNAVENLFSIKKTKECRGEHENIHKAFVKAFWRLDTLMTWKKEVPRARCSGCPAVTCILEGNIANTGNVQAVLCRNGKGFCLIKEHYVKHKKFIILVSQTITDPIDDLCQFLILATNGLWEVLDKKEVTALAITTFQVHKETHHSLSKKKSSSSKDPLLFPINKSSTTESEGNIHTLFQSKSEECVSTNSKENLSDSKYSKYLTCDLKSAQTFLLPEMTNHDPCGEKETESSTHVDGVPKASGEKENIYTGSFYKGTVECISRELIHAALMAGSKDNITVMVILLNGTEYQFLK
ncbi:LOW QUALITY PROTEIN: protein phosphatase 2C-like domain-containing protein 1 [Rhynchonycteris naso]